MLITREFIYVKKPSCCWRNQEASTVSCHCLPVWWVKAAHSQVTQINVRGLLRAACTTRTGAAHVSPTLTVSQVGLLPALSHLPGCLPPSGTGQACLKRRISIPRGLVQSSGLSPPCQDRGHPPTELGTGQLCHILSLDFYFLHSWVSSDWPSEEDPQCMSHLLCWQGLPWKWIVAIHLFLFMQSYRYYQGGKQALSIENKIK